MYDPKIVAEYIRQAAMQRGIDPNVALTVARSEGLNEYIGDGGSSFGPFQLHYGGVARGGNSVGGLGDIFTKRTGLDARNPDTWRQQVDFSLDEAKRGGWGPWHGWKGERMAGIGGRAANMATQPTAQATVPTAGLLGADAAAPVATKADPIADLLNMQPPAKREDAIGSMIASFAKQAEPRQQSNARDDEFVRQMMDFHKAQHLRAVQGLL